MKVYSCTFAYGGLEPWTVACRDRDHAALGTKLVVASSDLDAERGRCATRFLRSGDDVCLFVDRDMAWSENSVQYITAAAEHTKGVVSGLYPKRERGNGWCASIPPDCTLAIGSDELVVLQRPHACGAGFLAFHREAMERLADAEPLVEGDFHPVFTQLIIGSDSMRRRLPEDFSFFWRAQGLGIQCHLALWPVLDHFGVTRFSAHTATAEPDPPSFVLGVK